MVRVNTVSGQVNRDWLGRILTGKQRQGKSGIERALSLAAAVRS